MRDTSLRHRLALPLALGAVYFIWGSTYLGMRIALEAWPPLLMAAVRFTIAGGVLYAVLRATGTPRPARAEWLRAGIVGVLLLTCGNGFVAFAQSRAIDSGVAATVIATMPMWMALLGTTFGERPSRREIAGLALGFAGVALLRGGGSLGSDPIATIAVILSPVTWALGSLLGRKLAMPRGLLAAAMQMVVGGVVLLALSVLTGEGAPQAIEPRSVIALAYLIVFGSLVAFTAYGFLLRTARPAVASSYAYVNPVVAILLGGLFAGESLSVSRVLACTVIVAGVVLLVRPAPA